MNDELNTVIRQIKQRSIGKNIFLVAIDGRGGSGKTILAERIQKSLPKVTVVHIDDFYLLSRNRVIKAELPIDDNRLRMQLLEPLKQRRTAEYQQYDGVKDRMIASHIVTPEGIIVIEGWFSLYPTLASYYDYKIWKEEDKAVCLERGMQREIIEKKIDKEMLMARWEKYQLLEDQYIIKHTPQQLANIVLYG